MRFFISLILLESVLNLAYCDHKLAFVFELVRHGARAPLSDFPPEMFTVIKGELTPSGMRQRWLLGKFNR